jgi:hypothetical protein
MTPARETNAEGPCFTIRAILRGTCVKSATEEIGSNNPKNKKSGNLANHDRTDRVYPIKTGDNAS